MSECNRSILPKKDQKGRYFSTVRVKSSVSRVTLTRESGIDISEFLNKRCNKYIRKSLEKNINDLCNRSREYGYLGARIDKVSGGGTSAQMRSLTQALGTAVSFINEESRKDMKAKGYTTRDGRRVESKKPGKRKSRKEQQFSAR